MNFNNYETELLEYIQLPASAYLEARDRYHSVGEFLQSEASGLKNISPEIHPQGSFRLGTAIYPLTRNDEFDLDITLKCGFLTLAICTQKDFKNAVMNTIQTYSDMHGMKKVEEKRRCVRLNYRSSNAGDSLFHIDIVPAIYDTEQDRADIRSRHGLLDEYAVLITDKESPDYEKLNGRWLPSNPEGYALWFESRMSAELKQRKLAIMREENCSLDDVPTWKVKTGLQAAVQLLKWHRDCMFEKDETGKPVSIIITTLAASVYDETVQTVSDLITRMTKYLERSNWTVRNPVDPREVFTDKWKEPKHANEHLRDNFERWLRKAIADFSSLESFRLTNADARILLHRSFNYKLPVTANSSKPEIYINRTINKPYGY